MKPNSLVSVIALITALHLNIHGQVKILNTYWDDNNQHIMETKQILPDGTNHGYRKTFTWDGVQDLNMMYDHGVMIKKQELAQDGKTIMAELNYDNDGIPHGVQFSKSYFNPGVLSNHLIVSMNHGEITKAEKWDEVGLFLTFENNLLTLIYRDNTQSQLQITQEDKLLTGNYWEDDNTIVYFKNGSIDSVVTIDPKHVYRLQQDGYLSSGILHENNEIMIKKYQQPRGYSLTLEFNEASIDLRGNGITDLGNNMPIFWDKFVNTNTPIETRYYDKNESMIKKTEWVENSFTRETTYDKSGEINTWTDFKRHGNVLDWYLYNNKGELINSSELEAKREQEEWDALISAVTNEIHYALFTNAQSNGGVNYAHHVSDSNENSESKTQKCKYEQLILDSTLYQICLEHLPTIEECKELFKDSLAANNYWNQISTWESKALNALNSDNVQNNNAFMYFNFTDKMISLQKNTTANMNAITSFQKPSATEVFLQKNLKNDIKLTSYSFAPEKKEGTDYVDSEQAQTLGQLQIGFLFKYFTLLNGQIIFLPSEIPAEVKRW